jgi:hypothetical protein
LGQFFRVTLQAVGQFVEGQTAFGHPQVQQIFAAFVGKVKTKSISL